MKSIFVIIHLLLVHSMYAQITLNECIENGLKHKPNIKTAQADLAVAALKSLDAQSKFLPQIALAYEYRYNPIIATQVVPTGLFSSTPTSETQAIRFGTKWQQNAGVTVYQPLIDLSLKSKIKESKINESLANWDLKKAEEDFVFEIIKSYSQILLYQLQSQESASDSVRSYISMSMLEAKFKEGKVLKTELNTAKINHNNNLSAFQRAFSNLINEKIYLNYLTNISLEKLLSDSYTPINDVLNNTPNNTTFESSIDFQKFLTKEQLLNQQIQTEQTQYRPTLGVQGFIGANQYTQSINPFLANSWFGNSYVGLAVKLPIFAPDKSINLSKQLQKQLTVVENQKEEFKSQKNKDILQNTNTIERLQKEIAFAEKNIALLKENLDIYQARLQTGQLEASELNTQESALQKALVQQLQLKEQLNKTFMDRLYISGNLLEKFKK